MTAPRARGTRHTCPVEERELPGGLVTTVVRRGDTVRRVPGPNAPYVHRVLDHLHRRGWRGAPRFLGFDEQGREILEYLDGHVAWEAGQQMSVRSDASLLRAARLVREFHDLTAGTPLAASAEVVCHNDLSPRNTVYRDDGAGLLPVAFIDWDTAGPGARIHDVAHVCWQYVGLGPDADSAEAARSVRLVADGYGLPDRANLVDTILWWQDRCRRGIEAQAAAGDPAKVALRDSGVCDEIRAARAWVTAHRADFARALEVPRPAP